MTARRARSIRRAGFTLLEVMLTIGLLVLMIGVMFSFYYVTLRARDRGKTAVESTQLARVVANRIASEIRSASANVGTIGPGIWGSEREIKINSIVLPDQSLYQRRSIRDKPLEAQCDMREVSYYIGWDLEEQNSHGEQGTNLGLVRREVKTLRTPVAISTRNDQGIDTDMYAPEIKYVRFRYFDGVDWVSKWHVKAQTKGQNTLPQAVEVTVGYDVDRLIPPTEEELQLVDETDGDIAGPEAFRSDQFTVVARLPQADPTFASRLMRAQMRIASEGLGGDGLFDGGSFGSAKGGPGSDTGSGPGGGGSGPGGRGRSGARGATDSGGGGQRRQGSDTRDDSSRGNRGGGSGSTLGITGGRG